MAFETVGFTLMEKPKLLQGFLGKGKVIYM